MSKTTAAAPMSPAAQTLQSIPDVTDFEQAFWEHMRAGYQCMFISTSEEARVESEIGRIAKASQTNVYTWDLADGFSSVGNSDAAASTKYRQPVEALREVSKVDSALFKSNGIFIFRDLDEVIALDPVLRRMIRSLCEGNKLVNNKMKRPIIITSPMNSIHPRLKSSITPLEFNLPGETRLKKVLTFVVNSIQSSQFQKPSPELENKIIAATRGLTATEAENAISRCVVKHGNFVPEMIGTILDEKASIIKKSEVLTYIPEQQQVRRDEIGGFENFLDWLDLRRQAYLPEAQAEKIDYPKGAVLLGVPGTGKSMVASAAARLLGLPGYIMDVGSVFGSLVGESEARMRDAIKQVEAQQGCVLLLDEADKAFGGATTGTGDSGVTKRVFGQLLTWLSSKKDRTFVIMTLNRTAGIPPEFLRAGRFDRVFYTDLPNEAEREAIIKIHLRKRGVDPASLDLSPEDWQSLVTATDRFVGSELEQLVTEARYISWQKRRTGNPTFDELMEAKAGVIPLATLDQENISDIRSFCSERATPVSRQRVQPAVIPERKQRAVNPNA